MYFFSLFLFLISLSLFSSQLRNLPRTLNGLVSPSAPLLRADLFYLFAQPRGKSADYVEIPSPKPCESTSFQSFSRSFLFSFSPFLSSSQAFECLLACSSSVSITRSPPNKSIVSYRRLFSPIFARLSTRPIPRDHEAFTGEKPGDRQDQFKPVYNICVVSTITDTWQCSFTNVIRSTWNTVYLDKTTKLNRTYMSKDQPRWTTGLGTKFSSPGARRIGLATDGVARVNVPRHTTCTLIRASQPRLPFYCDVAPPHLAITCPRRYSSSLSSFTKNSICASSSSSENTI